jgi:hypothetical protein
VRIERLLAAGASIKGTARKFAIDYHALRRHWVNHVSTEARAAYIAGAGATKDQLEAIVADESLALIDHYRIARGGLYEGFGAASEIEDGNALALLAGRLRENLRDCGRLTLAPEKARSELTSPAGLFLGRMPSNRCFDGPRYGVRRNVQIVGDQ